MRKIWRTLCAGLLAVVVLVAAGALLGSNRPGPRGTGGGAGGHFAVGWVAALEHGAIMGCGSGAAYQQIGIEHGCLLVFLL